MDMRTSHVNLFCFRVLLFTLENETVCMRQIGGVNLWVV